MNSSYESQVEPVDGAALFSRLKKINSQSKARPGPPRPEVPPPNNIEMVKVYELYGETSRPSPATAFPVSHHQKQRSVAGICLSSAIRLIPPEPPTSNNNIPPSTFTNFNGDNSSKKFGLPLQNTKFDSSNYFPTHISGESSAFPPLQNPPSSVFSSNDYESPIKPYFPIYNKDNLVESLITQRDKNSKTPIFSGSDPNGLYV